MDHPQTKGTRMVEPMRPDPAEALRPPLSGSSVDRIMFNMRNPHAMLSVRIGVARHEEPIGQQLVRRLSGAAAVAQLRTRTLISAHTQGALRLS